MSPRSSVSPRSISCAKCGCWRTRPLDLLTLLGGRQNLDRPEPLLLALLLQAIYGLRSERIPIEQMNYNLLFRRPQPDGPVWQAATFTKNRDRLLNEALKSRPGCSASQAAPVRIRATCGAA
jgi:hypothetical protein